VAVRKGAAGGKQAVTATAAAGASPGSAHRRVPGRIDKGCRCGQFCTSARLGGGLVPLLPGCASDQRGDTYSPLALSSARSPTFRLAGGGGAGPAVVVFEADHVV
jgi:hypothetical protein